MKKLLYLLLVLPFTMMFSSCSNDNDLPNVEITMSFDNAAVDDGTVYVVQDSVFSITGISTKALDSNQQAAIANVRYFWNGYPAPNLTWSNMPIEIDMAQMPVTSSGKCLLGLNATLLETDKSMAYCSLDIPIQTVESVDSLPQGVEFGQVDMIFTVAQKSK
ncbi:MAG: hypothetical protein K2K45_08790 [Muribaculaceae bacterium]|nr:hypothetical protein [Muribaculaceae bacterium]MDE7096195.1 hypothetical protein [Muribaculaceae bacterium]